jgi:hypothetical protein
VVAEEEEEVPNLGPVVERRIFERIASLGRFAEARPTADPGAAQGNRQAALVTDARLLAVDG